MLLRAESAASASEAFLASSSSRLSLRLFGLLTPTGCLLSAAGYWNGLGLGIDWFELRFANFDRGLWLRIPLLRFSEERLPETWWEPCFGPCIRVELRDHGRTLALAGSQCYSDVSCELVGLPSLDAFFASLAAGASGTSVGCTASASR